MRTAQHVAFHGDNHELRAPSIAIVPGTGRLIYTIHLSKRVGLPFGGTRWCGEHATYAFRVGARTSTGSKQRRSERCAVDPSGSKTSSDESATFQVLCAGNADVAATTNVRSISDANILLRDAHDSAPRSSNAREIRSTKRWRGRAESRVDVSLTSLGRRLVAHVARR